MEYTMHVRSIFSYLIIKRKILFIVCFETKRNKQNFLFDNFLWWQNIWLIRWHVANVCFFRGGFVMILSIHLTIIFHSKQSEWRQIFLFEIYGFWLGRKLSSYTQTLRDLLRILARVTGVFEIKNSSKNCKFIMMIRRNHSSHVGNDRQTLFVFIHIWW